MATYNAAAGDVAVWNKTLVAATVDTVTFPEDRQAVRVYNDDGADVIWFTVDNTTPAANSAKSYRVPATAGAFVDVPLGQGEPGTTVKLISAGTPKYSVEGAR